MTITPKQWTAEGLQPQYRAHHRHTRPVNTNFWARVAIVVLAAIGTFAAGAQWGINHANDQLPKCEEDEYLYPHDYKGPGKNNTPDYGCFPIDG